MGKVAYIAGPYRAKTIKGIMDNILAAREVALKYWLKGYVVICPHSNTALFDGHADDAVWLEGAIELMRRCDVVVMMANWRESPGAIVELKVAESEDMEITYDDGEG